MECCFSHSRCYFPRIKRHNRGETLLQLPFHANKHVNKKTEGKYNSVYNTTKAIKHQL